MVPRVSVIIPARDRAAMLEAALFCLARQTFPASELEVVVIDDGSADATPELLCRSDYSFRLVSERLERSEAFCPARPRNAGFRHATGDIVLSLDADILAAPGFVAAHLAAHAGRERPQAVIGITCGYSADLGQRAAEHEPPPPMPLAEQVAALTRPDHPDWQDAREVEYAVSDDLRTHPAPWRFFWTHNVSISRRLALEVGGLDEEFMGWGGEDIEFAYRLFLAGAKFRVAREARALHYPHPVGPPGERQAQLQRNRRRIIAKHAHPRLELLLWTGADAARWAWERVESLHRQPPPPAWAAPGCREVALRTAARLGWDGRQAWFGPASYAAFEAGACCSPFAPAKEDARSGRLPLVGVFTPWEDHACRGVVVQDYWRWLPLPLLKGMVREALRVGGAALLVDSGAAPAAPEGVRVWPLDASLEAAAAAAPGLRCEPIQDRLAYLVREDS